MKGGLKARSEIIENVMQQQQQQQQQQASTLRLRWPCFLCPSAEAAATSAAGTPST